MLEEICTATRKQGDVLLELDATLGDISTLRDWEGAGAHAFRARMTQTRGDIREFAACTAEARRATADAADGVLAVQRALTEAEAVGATQHFAIGPNGEINDVMELTMMTPQDAAILGQQRARVLAELIDRIEQVVRTANDVEGDLVASLERAAREAITVDVNGSVEAAAALGDAEGGATVLEPPKGGGVGDNAGYWASLTPAQQRDVVNKHPEWVGNLDGVPASARDQANRSLLSSERTRLQAVATKLQAELDDNHFGGTFSNADAGLEQTKEKLKAIDAIEATLAQSDRHLLLLDLSGQNPKAAVAIGNVDTATHVSVYTNGLNDTVSNGLGGDVNDIRQLKLTTEDQLLRAGRGGETVATVAFLGYDAPQLQGVGSGLEDLVDGNSVLSEKPALAGADKLASFLNGIDASRTDDPHLTALGHSYGSLTTSLALQRGTGVDDAVFFGSPGLGTNDLSTLGLAPGHSFVAEAHGDFVADGAIFGPDPNQLKGITNLSTQAGMSPDGVPRGGSDGHSQYFNDKTMSQYNMGVVAAGLSNLTVQGTDRGIADIARTPVPDWVTGKF